MGVQCSAMPALAIHFSSSSIIPASFLCGDAINTKCALGTWGSIQANELIKSLNPLYGTALPTLNISFLSKGILYARKEAATLSWLTGAKRDEVGTKPVC